MSKILGIDVGGTKIALGLVDRRFKLSKTMVVSTSQTNMLSQLIGLIKGYSGFSGIALAVPGPVLSGGLVRRFPNIKNFKPTNIKLFFKRKFKVPVKVVNDAKALALAEASLGAGRKFRTVAGVILGTGIGVGFVNHKKIYFGTNSLAGELGHILLPDGQVFEQYVRNAGKFKNAKQAGKFLRLLLSLIVRSVDPEIVVFGGGWSKLPGMEHELKLQLAKIYHSPLKTVIKISKLKYAGILGAVLAFLNN